MGNYGICSLLQTWYNITAILCHHSRITQCTDNPLWHAPTRPHDRLTADWQTNYSNDVYGNVVDESTFQTFCALRWIYQTGKITPAILVQIGVLPMFEHCPWIYYYTHERFGYFKSYQVERFEKLTIYCATGFKFS